MSSAVRVVLEQAVFIGVGSHLELISKHKEICYDCRPCGTAWQKPSGPDRGKSRSPCGRGLNPSCRRRKHLSVNGMTAASREVAGHGCQTGRSSPESFSSCGRGANGLPCLENSAAAPRFTGVFKSGNESVCGSASGLRDWLSTMSWQALPGAGRRRTGRGTNRRWGARPLGQTPRIGGKKWVKRNLLVDARGVPLSLVVTGANTHDSVPFETLLDAIMVTRPRPRRGRPQTGCADKAYDSSKCRALLAARGYRDGIKSRGDERREKRRNPRKKARRWVVERTHSWFNNWRKIRVRYERKLQNHVALLCIVAGIIALRAADVLR